MYAHTKTFLLKDVGWRIVHPKGIQPLLLSLCKHVCQLCTCTYVRLLGPCFKTGQRKPFCHHHEHIVTELNPTQDINGRHSQHKRAIYQPNIYPRRRVDADPCKATAPLPQVAREIWLSFGTGFLRFPFNNFRYSLTLFSKFFASFPHGTCALSLPHQY